MGQRVPIVLTPWAPPLDHAAIVVNLDAALRAEGVEELHVRRRLIAHAVIACGWKQGDTSKGATGGPYNWNLWKSKLGGSSGDYYVHNTEEEKDGETVKELGTKWRAYDSIGAALADYRVWHLSRYAKAKAALLDPETSDLEVGKELQAAGYWTATSGAAAFAGVCSRVGVEMKKAGLDTRPFVPGDLVGPAVVGFGLWGVVALGIVGVVLVAVGVHLVNKRGV